MEAPTTRHPRPRADRRPRAHRARGRRASRTSASRPTPTPVSVPAGAHAGQLTLKPCTYATEHGSYAADCGTLVVPENRHDPARG